MASETTVTDTPNTKLCCNPFAGRLDFKGCQNPGTKRCTGCAGAKPETLYCSVDCQRKDWRFHKKYCGKKAYKFKLKLVGSSNPVITRSFSVPSWYTFREFHYALQYSMGPWGCTHLHEFTFETPSDGPRWTLSRRNVVLRIGDEEDASEGRSEFERDVRLCDVFETTGRLHHVVAPQGKVLTLYYLYDFGDNWDHEITFKGEELARADRPLFKVATGCGPVEDSGAIPGWDNVKAAFRAVRPNKKQCETQAWAREVSGLGDAFDPFKEPDVKVMNYEGRWENHLRSYMEMMGEDTTELGF